MKVFMVHEDPWHAGNPYIYTLIEGIQKSHSDCEISWGREKFWSEDIFSFDIVHFHWPQTFMGRDSHSEDDLLHHIEKMKSVGVKVIATCHDLEPHYDLFADKAESMRIVYSHSDAIIHLGEYSKNLFEKRYPSASHLLLPHHLYDTVYTFFPSKKESLKHLRLPENRICILCFGSFRAKQEHQLIINLSKQLSNKKIIILAPCFMSIWWRSFRMFHKRLKKLYYQYRYNIYCTGSGWNAVSDESLPYYYGAADVVFIQRLKILNSGNAMMPILFDKVVVGPDCGNVGGFLSRWGYPVFNVNELQSVGESVLRGINLEKKGYSHSIHAAQMNEYSSSIIVERLFIYYKNILKR